MIVNDSTIHEDYKKRRQFLFQTIGCDGIAILPAASDIIRNGDIYYPYRQNSDFHYLTGFDEPAAVVVLVPCRAEGQTILFNRVRDPMKEIWNGKLAGQEGACQDYGADQAFAITELNKELPELLKGRKQIYYDFGKDSKFDQTLLFCIKQLRQQIRKGINAPDSFVSLDQILHEMRLIKSKYEQELMRNAAHISVEGHRRAMQCCKPGMKEYQLAAEIHYECQRQGCESMAYGSIVGGGKNGCVLHYDSNREELMDGDLVLIDAAGEFQKYAADITRTFPVNGRFSPEQKLIYEIVLEAQKAGIDSVKPGNLWTAVQGSIIPIITAGLVDLGILKGNVDDLIQQKAYHQFYMHNSGHWLGLDVHDVGSYKVDAEWRTLRSGMALTVEPGIYIAANSPNVDEKWWNMGVRIEDDILITDNGNENLSADVPREIEEIEALMRA